MVNMMPYFQAYLNMKNKADSTEDELMLMKQRLAAASKKLHAIEESVNEFGAKV